MKLEIKNLCLKRGDRYVIHDLTLSLRAGECLILKGPNGVGKSTLIRALAGLIPITSGSVDLLEHSLQTDRSSYQEQLVYSGHLDAIKHQMTIYENIQFWASIYGESRSDKITKTMQNFDLYSLKDKIAARCSAGQKRRLGLTRILIADKPLWLMDEPTVGLDAENTKRFAHLVSKHCAAGGMALIATHIDLGIKQIREFTLSPLQDNEVETDDPFAGDWA